MKRKPTASAKKATREMSGEITRKYPEKEIIQEQTDPNLKGKRKAENEKN